MQYFLVCSSWKYYGVPAVIDFYFQIHFRFPSNNFVRHLPWYALKQIINTRTVYTNQYKCFKNILKVHLANGNHAQTVFNFFILLLYKVSYNIFFFFDQNSKSNTPFLQFKSILYYNPLIHVRFWFSLQWQTMKSMIIYLNLLINSLVLTSWHLIKGVASRILILFGLQIGNA